MRRASGILLSDDDSVAVLPDGGSRGDLLSCGGIFVELRQDVPPGHKAALRGVERGGIVRKYGHPIGEAVTEIVPGDWVHTHNLKTRLSQGDVIERAPRAASFSAAPLEAETFLGFQREGRRAGIRNEIWVIPTVGCIGGELRALAGNYSPPPWIDCVRVLEHPHGCSQLGDDLDRTADALAGLAQNPNAAGVLVAGLGCENLELAMMEERLRGKADTRFLSMQDPGSDVRFAQTLRELADNAPRERTSSPVADLAVGVKCGGSDGYSGITANPLLGRFSDALAASGGTILATEIPEMFGAESVLTTRMDYGVFESFVELDSWFRDYFTRHERPIYENPSPGNVAGGITTLEEKSLGAVEKAGCADITRVLRYGEPAERRAGVQILFAPGNDLVSCTALAASGAQMILFTTGRGTPFGTVVPTLKVSTNSKLARDHPGWIDFDAGTLLAGADWSAATAALARLVLATAAGRPAAHELRGHGEIALFKDGVIL